MKCRSSEVYDAVQFEISKDESVSVGQTFGEWPVRLDEEGPFLIVTAFWGIDYRVNPSDFIIVGDKRGMYRPCSPDEYKEKYEEG